MQNLTITAGPLESRGDLRFELACRARIRIVNRNYSGALINISCGGACIETNSTIREVGEVRLTVPDLGTIKGTMRWVRPKVAGILFDQRISEADFNKWLKTRSVVQVSDTRQRASAAAPDGRCNAQPVRYSVNENSPYPSTEDYEIS